MRLRLVIRFVLAGALMLPVLLNAAPASANVSRLVLHRRTCQNVTAYAVYDGFSGGVPPFFAVFAADLNGNGVFGEPGEPVAYVRVNSTIEEPSTVGTRLTFRALPEGSTISVTAFEIDNAGNLVSAQLEPVSYECTHRPALDPLPANTGITAPTVAVTARVLVESVRVYSGPSGDSVILGALGQNAIVNVTARNPRGDWVRIDFQGGTGWIMWQTQAALIGPSSRLPVE